MDLIGLDTTLAILEVLHRELGDPKYRPCPLLRQYVAAGWLGRKTRARLLPLPDRRAPALGADPRRSRRVERRSRLGRCARRRATARSPRHRQPARGAQRARRRRRCDALSGGVRRRSTATPAVRCAILTGAGDKAFVAGADIKAMADARSARARALRRARPPAWATLIEALARAGHRGGQRLRAGRRAASWRWPATSSTPRATAKLGHARGRPGRHPRLRRHAAAGAAVGVARARELIYTGATHRRRRGRCASASCNEVVEPAELMPRVRAPSPREIAAPARRWPSPAAKRALPPGPARTDEPLADGARRSNASCSPALFATDDQKEGMRAFVDKRAARHWTTDA